MPIAAILAILSTLGAGAAYGAETYAQGKKRKAMGRYAAKQGYNRARSEAILREQEQAGYDLAEQKTKELGDDELWGLLTSVMTGTGMSAGDQMGSPQQLESSMAMASGDPNFGSRLRVASQPRGNPILSAFGIMPAGSGQNLAVA